MTTPAPPRERATPGRRVAGRTRRRSAAPVEPVAAPGIPVRSSPPGEEDYRSAMRQIPAAVAVVTTCAGGVRQGLTVTAVSSVSADTPQLLVCVNRETRSGAAISAAGQFAVNFLDTDHAGLANVFAAPTDDHAGRFDRAEWVDGPAGSPLLRDALVAFDCVVVNEMNSGTHTSFIGQVVGIRARDGRPLLHRRGTFTTTE